MTATAFDFDQALLDPAAAFQSPEDVLRASHLRSEQKIEILCRWAYDCVELSVAEEEGMGGGESADLAAVMAALAQLGVSDLEHHAPTKHGAFCARRGSSE